jgi:hypothetical protein
MPHDDAVRAGDGSSVILTWDEMAGSTRIWWVDAGHERLAVEREAASKISVRSEGGNAPFHVWSRSQGLGGELVIRVGEGVSERFVAGAPSSQSAIAFLNGSPRASSVFSTIEAPALQQMGFDVVKVRIG